MQSEEASKEDRNDAQAPTPVRMHIPLNAKKIRIAVIVLTLLVALGILVSVLGYIRQQAFRMTCATNLAGIGMAMRGYAHDYDGEFPRSGGPDSNLGMRIPNWMAKDRSSAYGLTAEGAGGVGTISSSFYLLPKYGFSLPYSSFVCKGDAEASVFDPDKEGAAGLPLWDLWDFGNTPAEHVSYSYHMPFGLYRLTSSSNPGMAIAADRNPYIPSPMAEPKSSVFFRPEGPRQAVKAGNAVQHQEEGQNVLFLDSHVAFEKVPFCGVMDDNIYTFWNGGDIRRGAQPVLGTVPQDESDSLLVNDAY